MEPITCLQEFLQAINDNEAAIKEAGDTFTPYYRGQSNETWHLEPSVFREHLYNEHNLFHEMERNLYHELSSFNSTLDKLVFMQHYLLPTRLLDITKNPLVALYFACITHQKCEHECDNKEGNCKDDKCAHGAIYLFNEYEKYDKRDAQIIALLSQLPIDFSVENLQKLIKEELQVEVTMDKLLKVLSEEFVLVKSNKSNNRVIKQDGDFFIFSNNYANPPKVKFNVSRDENKVIISKEHKENILEELDKIGINRYSLFPEPDHLAKYLRHNLKDNSSEANRVSTRDALLQNNQMANMAKFLDYMDELKIYNDDLDLIVTTNNILELNIQEKIFKIVLKEYGLEYAEKIKEYLERL